MSEGYNEIFAKATAFFKEGKYNDAIELYGKLIIENKLGAEPLFWKAEALVHLDRNGEAIEFYDKALDIDQDNAAIWYAKGMALYHAGNYVPAHVCFECANDIDPKNLDYFFKAVETALITGDHEDALELARGILNTTDNLEAIALGWVLSIIILFLQKKPLNALDTLDEFVHYMLQKNQDLIPENDFKGTDYDLCGIEKYLVAAIVDATANIVNVTLEFLKGNVPIDHLTDAVEANKDLIKLDDVKVLVQKQSDKDFVEEYPDFNLIINTEDRVKIERVDEIVEAKDDQFSFKSFAHLFDHYDWGVDRGPAPFIVELENRFYIEIESGQVKRLSIDLDILINAIATKEPGLSRESTTKKAGHLLSFSSLEEIFITAHRLASIIDFMRSLSMEKGKEITAYVNVDLIADEQEDMLALNKIDEISDIDEIPVDFQAQGKRLTKSLTWKFR